MTASSFRKDRGLKPLLLAVALSAGLHTGATLAQTAASASQTIDIPAGSLAQALDRLGEQTGALITYEPGLVQGLNAPRVSGQLSASEALRRLLNGSGIQMEAVNEKTFVLRRAVTNPAPSVGQAQQSASRRDMQEEPATQDLDKVTVTGTRIRGGSAPSPVITIGSERIREEGFADLGEVIRSVPQNFSGGQNPGLVAGAEGGGIANQNISGGSALNLRGLGPDSTLTLLNGRRLAYSGFVQAVDISAIPVEAIDRLEIIPDGASAIYGSDAVGGVGNVILKRDYEGVTVGARYGDATDGGLTTREYTVTAGSNWLSGGLIATWKKSSSDPICSDQRDYTDHLYSPTTLYPDSDLRSGLLSVHQSLGDSVELRLDALRTERDQLIYYTATPTNYFPATAETTTSLASPSAGFSLPNDWKLSIGGTWGEDKVISSLSIGTTATGVVTPFVARNLYRNKSLSYEVSAEGPLFALPGGDARLAVGAGYRTNEFLQSSLLSGIATADGDESSRFAYVEINVPLIDPNQQTSGVQRLTLTAAMRGEDYDSFGSVTTPKLGMIYGPSADFTLKTSWGKSFKAPTLLQRYQPRFAHLRPAATVGGIGYASDATVLIPYGGNSDLEPERARTWSASIAFHPEALPALEVELGWFDIDFAGRIAQPLVNQAEALSSPVYAQFIDYSPSVDEQTSIITNSEFSNFTGAPYDPDQVVAIAFNRYINTVAQRVKGFDLSGSYRLDVGLGRLTVRGSISWLDSSQQTTTADSVYALSGTLFYPARINGRIGAVWGQGGFSASTFANYSSGVTNTVDGSKSSSFTTIDATLRYATGERDGLFSGLDFALSATNLLDRSPPLYMPTSVSNPPYDSTNYSPIGRFLSVSVSKHW